MARRSHLLTYGLLVASLAINLVGAGYLATTAAWPERPRRTVETTIDFVTKRYPGAVGDAVRAELEARRGVLGRALEEMQAARRDTREAMAADPLDQARLDSAFGAARVKANDFQKIIHEAVISSLPKLSADDRRQVVRKNAD